MHQFIGLVCILGTPRTCSSTTTLGLCVPGAAPQAATGPWAMWAFLHQLVDIRRYALVPFLSTGRYLRSSCHWLPDRLRPQLRKTKDVCFQQCSLRKPTVRKPPRISRGADPRKSQDRTSELTGEAAPSLESRPVVAPSQTEGTGYVSAHRCAFQRPEGEGQ